MSKPTKSSTGQSGGGRKRGNETKEEPSIFCEKCVFVFQGDEEFKSHGCQKRECKNTGVIESQNKKTTISLEKKKGKTSNERVIRIISFTFVLNHL